MSDLPPVEVDAGRVTRGWVLRLGVACAGMVAVLASRPDVGELVPLAVGVAVLVVRPGVGFTGLWLAGLGIALLRDPQPLEWHLLALVVLGVHATHYLGRFAHAVGLRGLVQLAALRSDLPMTLAVQGVGQVLAFAGVATARAELPAATSWLALAGVLATLGVVALILPPLVRAQRT